MLPPPFLAGQQLPDLLRRLQSAIRARAPFAFSFSPSGADKPVNVIALQNPLRHAPSSIVEIALSALPVSVTLSI